jgi:16S rRNA (guanine527-N7)-methyltransferase
VEGPGSDPKVSPAILEAILADARSAGFLGPGPLGPHVEHARGFASTARSLSPDGSGRQRIVDLGSGGGLPGLVMAVESSAVHLVLVEANSRRARFLSGAVEQLGVGDRVQVVQGRAEVIGRDASFRATFDGAVARSFGSPAVVAECAAPLLKVRGWLVVSEPPSGTEGESERWPAGPLAELGLVPVKVARYGYAFQVLRQTEACPATFPRRDGVPAKRPLF